MSTNYYVIPRGADTEDESTWIHLGKSSFGWTFSFRAYPKPAKAPAAITAPVTDFESWARLLDLGTIMTEAHREVSKTEMLEIAQDRRDAVHGFRAPSEQWLDDRGHRFESREFC